MFLLVFELCGNLSICKLWFVIGVCAEMATRWVSLLRDGLGLLAGTAPFQRRIQLTIQMKLYADRIVAKYKGMVSPDPAGAGQRRMQLTIIWNRMHKGCCKKQMQNAGSGQRRMQLQYTIKWNRMQTGLLQNTNAKWRGWPEKDATQWCISAT